MLRVFAEREIVFEGSVTVLEHWRKYDDKRQMHILQRREGFK